MVMELKYLNQLIKSDYHYLTANILSSAIFAHYTGNRGQVMYNFTLIVTQDGLIPIEAIKIGDKVWAYNEDNKTKSLQEVTHLIRGKKYKEIVEIELKTASSLVEASNIQTKPDEKELAKLLSSAKDTTERNQRILQAYQEGYSQHLIARVLGLAQPTVNGIIKRGKRKASLTLSWFITLNSQ